MAFDHLLNQPDGELQLLQKLAAAVQANFNVISPYYYLKLKFVEDAKSEIIWIKSFKNREGYKDQLYAPKFEQAKMAVMLRRNYYRVAIYGFAIFTFADVYADHIKYFRKIWPTSRDIESKPCAPRELIEGGIGDLRKQFSQSATRRGSG